MTWSTVRRLKPLVNRHHIETPEGFEPTYQGFADLDLNHSDTVSLILDPGVGFEPTWDFSACLQGKCNQPLCEPGIYSIQFKKKWSLRKMEGSNLIQFYPNISLSRRILSPFRVIFHWRDLGDSNPDLHSDSVLCKPLHHRPRKKRKR